MTRQIAQAGFKMKKFWLTLKDEKVCSLCSTNMADGWIPIDQPHSSGHERSKAHPGCFVPETLCTVPNPLAGMTIPYDGPVIEILDDRGERTTITPNHMFLTPNGFSSANLLRKGDNILCCTDLIREVSINPNNNRDPTRIDDIIKSFSKNSGVLSRSVPPTPEDLHGDGRFSNGNIDIISSNCFLGDAFESMINERIQTDLLNSSVPPSSLDSKCNLTSILFSLALATDGGMSGIRQSSPFFRSRLGHPQIHGITSTPWGNSHLDQAIYDEMTRDTKNLRHMLNRFARFIDLTEIVEINVLSYHGYVYDCQTLSTLYIGNGLVSSNCRCPELYRADLPDIAGPQGDFALKVDMVESDRGAQIITILQPEPPKPIIEIIREVGTVDWSIYNYAFNGGKPGTVASTIVDCGRPGRQPVNVLDGGRP